MYLKNLNLPTSSPPYICKHHFFFIHLHSISHPRGDAHCVNLRLTTLRTPLEFSLHIFQSEMITKWNYQPLTLQQKTQAEEMLSQCGGAAPIAELLIRRGVNTPRGAQAFFSPAIADLHDPFLMPDMDKAVNRLNKAMGAKERIMIYGDYDVDGTTAVALVYKYLQNYYSNIE